MTSENPQQPKTMESLKEEEKKLYEVLATPGISAADKQSYSKDLERVQDEIEALAPSAPASSSTLPSNPVDLDEIIRKLEAKGIKPVSATKEPDSKDSKSKNPVLDESASWRQLGRIAIKKIRGYYGI